MPQALSEEIAGFPRRVVSIAKWIRQAVPIRPNPLVRTRRFAHPLPKGSGQTFFFDFVPTDLAVFDGFMSRLEFQ